MAYLGATMSSPVYDSDQWLRGKVSDEQIIKMKTWKVSSESLQRISKLLTQWDVVSTYLELSSADIEAISRDYRDTERQRIEALEKWKQKRGESGTYYALALAFEEARRRDLVDELLMTFKFEVNLPKVKEVLRNCASVEKRLDLKKKEEEEKDAELQRHEEMFAKLARDWERYQAEWIESHKESKESKDRYAELVKDRQTTLRYASLGITFLMDWFYGDHKFLEEVLQDAEAAELDLVHGKKTSSFLDELNKHMRHLEYRETGLIAWQAELSTMRNQLSQQLDDLDDLQFLSKECSRDLAACERALEKCDTGISDCNQRIKNIRQRLEEVEKERKKILQEVENCAVKLDTYTKELESCQEKVTVCITKLKRKAEDIDRSIATFRSIPVVGWMISITEFFRGTDVEKQQQQLRECQESLDKCDNVIQNLKRIVMECDQEVKNMKRIIYASK